MNAGQRVLIIDSDLKNCKAIKYALTEYGIGAYYTLSVIDGIECLTRHNYKLVFLDISLSETDGLQLLRFMRQMKNMPILVLSFQGGIEHRARAYEMGADDFIQKPLELQECLLRAQALLRRYNAAAPPLPGQRRFPARESGVFLSDLFRARAAAIAARPPLRDNIEVLTKPLQTMKKENIH